MPDRKPMFPHPGGKSQYIPELLSIVGRPVLNVPEMGCSPDVVVIIHKRILVLRTSCHQMGKRPDILVIVNGKRYHIRQIKRVPWLEPSCVIIGRDDMVRL